MESFNKVSAGYLHSMAPDYNLKMMPTLTWLQFRVRGVNFLKNTPSVTGPHLITRY